MAAGADTLVSDLSAGEAATARDALCRTMYSRLFTLIVARINEAIKVIHILKVSHLVLELCLLEYFPK